MKKFESYEYVKNAAICSIKNPSHIVLVSEKIHISMVKQFIIENVTKTFEMPKIISIEGIESDNEFLSRNFVFAWFYHEIQKNKTIERESIAFFVRSIIGELPNLYANNIKPDDILAKIPVKISSERENNLYIFVHFWKLFEKFLQDEKKIPYYAKSQFCLEQLLQKGNKFIVIDDFGRSPVLQNFSQQLDDESYFFSYKDVNIKNDIYFIQNQKSEIVNIVLVLQYLLENGHQKIGIVAESESEIVKISEYIKSSLNIVCGGNGSYTIHSNALLKAFLILCGKYDFIEIITLLNVDEFEKKYLFKQLLKNQYGTDFIKLCKSISFSKNVFDILNFIKENKQKFSYTKEDGVAFFQFIAFLQTEIKDITENLVIDKEIILHIASSWKDFSENISSCVKICNLRHAHLQNFDAIILTSSYKIESAGNVIFSTGMRKFYGFDIINDTKSLISAISCNIFTTCNIAEISNKKPILINETKQSLPYKLEQMPLKIDNFKKNIDIYATELECLFKNSVEFYYKYIKNLKEFSYTSNMSIEIGNLIHKILEKCVTEAWKESDIKNSIVQHFEMANLSPFLLFYYENIFDICLDIAKKNNIKVETEFAYNFTLNDVQFCLKSKSDRVDFDKNVTIIDYKTGKSKDFEKQLNNNESAQLFITALALFNNQNKNIMGKYVFVGEDVCFSKNINEKDCDDFLEKTKQILKKYYIDGELIY